MKIVQDSKFPVSLNLWGIAPRQIEAEERQELKKDSHIMQLRYAAMELCSSEFLIWEDCQLCRDEIEDHASVCGDALYLNDFEGYRLGESLTLHYLYMNTDDRMCAALHDEEADDYTYWCIY